MIKNKFIIFFILVLIFAGGYFGYNKFFKKHNFLHYATAKVEKGTLIVSVSGSGQISPSDQVDIKPKVSGEVEEIFVEKDQRVQAGDLLLKLKTKEFESTIDEAKLALDNAKTTLENLKRNKENSLKDLKDSYEDVFKAISNIFNDLPQIMEKLEPIFTESSYGGDQADIDYYQSVVGLYSEQSLLKDEKEKTFSSLKEKYQTIRNEYLSLSRFSPPESFESWLKKTSDLVKEISDLSRSGRDIISFCKEMISRRNLILPISSSIIESQLTNLTTTTSSLEEKFSTLSSLSKTIDQLKDSISDYDSQIDSQERTIKQKEDALDNAKENYENCFVRASFDGQIAKVNIKKGDTVSTTAPLFTLISNQKIAEISLNEIDTAKVKVGQKATLTFDALPDLTLTGKVSEIDTIGTVSQGVVSYGVKIILDTDDERIKPGMSVTAEIIVEFKQDVLLVPNSALKSQQNVYYVQLMEDSTPRSQPVEVGISNDNMTEIISGLKEGDVVVTSTINPTQASQNQRAPQFQIPGMSPQIRMR